MVKRPTRPGHRILTCGGELAKVMLMLAPILVCLMASGCRQKNSALHLKQLTPGERLYIERVVTLERAKAVILVQRSQGAALLDSLATAWGDSALQTTLAGAPTDPVRAQLVNNLLIKILEAEADSLILDPGPQRLQASLPDVH